MNKIILLISFFIFANSNFIVSQVTQEWIQRYNGPGNYDDEATSIAVDGSGNVYVTGISYGSGTFSDYTTIKYNTSGVLQWIQRYNGTGTGDSIHDKANSITVDNSGNVYVTGESTGWGTGIDYVTIKYNPAGDSLWVRRYNGLGNSTDAASSIAVDGSGNVYVTGTSLSYGTGYDYATIKYNSAGVQQWVKSYNGTGMGGDYAYSIAVDGSGNVFVTGCSKSSEYDECYATIKYNSSGVEQWLRWYNGPANYTDKATSIALDGSGNVYVTGSSYGNGSMSDYATIKYNTAGDLLWVKRYNGPGNSYDEATSIKLDESGNVYVTGTSFGIGTVGDYATIKYNPAGDTLWIKRYNGPGTGNDVAYSLALDLSGNVYITGRSMGSGTSYDYATIKYNSSGVQQWVQRYNGPDNNYESAASIALDLSGNVYVTGSSYSIGKGKDYATIKYSQSTGIRTISNEIPADFILLQNYPNPFNPETTIKFSIPKAQHVTLKVYDAQGKELDILVCKFMEAGNYSVLYDAARLPSGVYFYKITTDSYTDIKKMMLVK